MSFLGDQRQYLATEKSHPGVFLFSGLSYFYECSPRAAVPWLLLAPPTPRAHQLLCSVAWVPRMQEKKLSTLQRMSQGGVGCCVKCEILKELVINAAPPPTLCCPPR